MEIQANNPLDGAGDSGSIAAATNAFEQLLSGDPQESDAPDDDVVQAGEQDSEDTLDGEDDTDDSADSEDDTQDAEDSEDDSEDSEDADQPEQKFTVTVAGEEVEVELPELLNGYMRTADYTRKTQALAEQRRAIEAGKAELIRQHEEYAQILPILREKVMQQAEQEPNWYELSQTDPDAYLRERARWDVKQRQLQDIHAEQARMTEIQQQQYEQSLGLRLEQEGERLVSAIPKWSDAKVAASERQAILEYAQEKLGYQRDELSQIYDHRAVVTLRKAMMFDQMMGKKDAVKPVKPATVPTLKPGASSSQVRPTSDLTKAKQRLAKTGTLRDAQAVFERMLSK